MTFGKRANGGAHRGEAVLPGGGETFEQVKCGERVVGLGQDFRGCGVREIIAEEGDESLHERAVGIATEMTAAVTKFAEEPDLGDAAGHAVGVGALVGRQWRPTARTIHDSSETLLEILNQQMILN